MKTLIIVVVVFVAAVVGLVLFSGNAGGGGGAEFALDKVSELDHVKGLPAGEAGNASSTVVLIEYSDFQCPACRSYYPILLELSQTYGDRIAFVYRHYPLKSIHINADPAAWASEAADNQGKFWEMHNLLFEKQDEWAKAADLKATFGEYATLLSLDKEKFLADLDSKQVKNFVNDQRQSALQNGFNATPTFVLNGKKIENPQSIEAFKLLINKAIQESTI